MGADLEKGEAKRREGRLEERVDEGRGRDSVEFEVR